MVKPLFALSNSTTEVAAKIWGASGQTANIFEISPYGAATKYFLVDSSGNVGIGTTNPSSKLDITTAGLGTTQTTTSGLALVNTTAAAAGLQQISPAVRWSGYGWKTDATAGSQAVDFRSYVVPVQGAANPTGFLAFDSSINGGAYSATPTLTLTSGGNVGIGTTDPSQALDVIGNIELSGNIGLAGSAPEATTLIKSISTVTPGTGTFYGLDIEQTNDTTDSLSNNLSVT